LDVEYVGLVAMLLVGWTLCAALVGLRSWLRSGVDQGARLTTELPVDPAPPLPDPRLNGDVESRSPETAVIGSASEDLAARRPLARYFVAAVLAVVLHSALIFFYIWGATLEETGLNGFVAILCFSACLLIGLIYAWSRGAIDAMKSSDP
jgi:NADH:ubiquinone oxidoreductase subunit 3 (subunit A)